MNFWDEKRKSCDAPEENNYENSPEKADLENADTYNERTFDNSYGRGRGRGRVRMGMSRRSVRTVFLSCIYLFVLLFIFILIFTYFIKYLIIIKSICISVFLHLINFHSNLFLLFKFKSLLFFFFLCSFLRGGHSGRGDRSMEKNNQNEDDDRMKDEDNISSVKNEKEKDYKDGFSENENNHLGKFKRNSFLGNKKIASRLSVLNNQNPLNSNSLDSNPSNTNITSSFSSSSSNINLSNINHNNTTGNSSNNNSKDKDKEKEEILIRDEINWVECSMCAKWRKVPRNIQGEKLKITIFTNFY